MEQTKNLRKITVFTPTYNRAYIIETLYRSLQRQTCQDFEWLVVDDGSADNTEELFTAWQAEDNPFPIRYYKQENGGKHRAINCALNKAAGELFLIVDSDDYLTDDAVERVLYMRTTLPEENDLKCCGVVGCRGYPDGQIVGRTFDGVFVDCLSYERDKYGITGDKAEAFFTEILKNYPFPEFEGEKFVTEAAVWDKMALDGYMLRYFNETVYLCEYLEDGLTHQGLDLYYRNPQGYGYYLRQCREVGKFSKALQRYFDAECYLHWRKQMTLYQIATLIGTRAGKLWWVACLHQARQLASKCKQWLLGLIRKEEQV